MKDKELILVTGGAFSLSAATINAIVRGAEAIYNLGRSLGSTLKMWKTGKKCS